MPRLGPLIIRRYASISVASRGQLPPSSLCAPPEAHAQWTFPARGGDLCLKGSASCQGTSCLSPFNRQDSRVGTCACHQGEGTHVFVLLPLPPPPKYSFFNDPPTFKRNCCLPHFQKGQKAVVLATKQETQSPFRSFELAGRAGPEMITFL